MENIIEKATPYFELRVKKLITKDALAELIQYLEQYPEQCKISGTCGVSNLG